MLRTNRDDVTAMWMGVMRQLVATASAIGDAMLARGEVMAAQRVQVALRDVAVHFPADTGVESAPEIAVHSQQHGARPNYLRWSSTTSRGGHSR